MLAPERGDDTADPCNIDEDPELAGMVLLEEDLEMEKVIGSGAFSEVWRGVHKPTSEQVAIKRLHMVDADAKALEGYIREVKMLAELVHPAIVHFIGFTKKYPFCIVTKFVSGGSLFHAIHDGGQLTATEKSVIAYGIAAGMQYLHAHNVIHRDLKPQNVLLDENKLPVICDLGSGRCTQEQRMMTNSGGTANYMAPEFLSSTEYNHKVDVYSYGLVLCEMLSGEIPFESMESAQVIYSVFIKRMRPDIPESVGPKMRKLIEWCWAHDPAERPEFCEIAKMFREGEVQFEGTDDVEFARAVERLDGEQKLPVPRAERSATPVFTRIPKKKRRTVQRRDSLPVAAIRMQAKANTFQNGRPILPVRPKKTLVADSRDVEEIAELEARVEDVTVSGEVIWPKLLGLVMHAPKELFQRVRRTVKMYAESAVQLGKIKEVSNLHEYVCPSTLDVFLYVVSYCPQAMTDRVVTELMKLTTDEVAGAKALVLLCKVLQAQVYNPRILDFFLENAIEFADSRGGHLVLRTLVRHDIADKEIVMAYAASSISANIIAAYQAVFSVPMFTPDCFRLDSILTHAMSCDFELRRESLEFIRRFSEDAAGEPLKQLCDTLFSVVMKYDSDAALLLLCRIAKDMANCQYMLENREWMKWKGSSLFINLFLVIFSHARLQAYIMAQEETIPFLGHAVDMGWIDEVLGVSWVIQQVQIDSDTAKALDREGIVERMAHIVCETKVLRYVGVIVYALSQIVPHFYTQTFELVVAHVLELLKDPNVVCPACLVFLSSLSQRSEAKSSFEKENAKDVLLRYSTSHPDAQSCISGIIHNLDL